MDNPMCQRSTSHHPIFCILPPYILSSIAQSGGPRQRARALRTLATDSTFRALRATPRAPAPTARRRPSMLAVEGQKQRMIFDAHNTESLPGDIVRTEGAAPSGDPAVEEAYDGLGATFDFFSEAYDRNSIDDEGLPLNASVHFGQEYNNAFWNGERMVFGDGDGELSTASRPLSTSSATNWLMGSPRTKRSSSTSSSRVP
jgi:hypothetical protein